MKQEFRCNCPITSAIDILGDKWTLVIIKQMLLHNKKTFKDFTESEEAIATNILASRIKKLTELELVTKAKLPTNNKSVFYLLTEKGLSLTPIIIEMAIWSGENLNYLNKKMVKPNEIGLNKGNKEEYMTNLITNYKEELDTTTYITS